MHLQEDETILKTYHHHPTTFVFRAVNYVIVSLPFYFVAWFLSAILSAGQMAFIYAAIVVVFGLLMAYDLFFFFFDRLIITNKRIVHIDWKSAFRREEHEAELVDIQDVSTEEAGILSALGIFDFGLFQLETASTKTTITFKDAPDPEGIKHFIYHLHIKPTRIGAPGLVTPIHDTARQIVDEEAAVSRRQ